MNELRDDIKIKSLELDLKHAKTQYLIKNGWQSTSNNPLKIVLWEKELSNRTIMVDIDIAVKMQDQLDFDQRVRLSDHE
jgi:hypothetical protein